MREKLAGERSVVMNVFAVLLKDADRECDNGESGRNIYAR